MFLDAVDIVKLCVCVAVGKPILANCRTSECCSSKQVQYHFDEVLENEGPGFLCELKTRDTSPICSNEAFLNNC